MGDGTAGTDGTVSHFAIETQYNKVLEYGKLYLDAQDDLLALVNKENSAITTRFQALIYAKVKLNAPSK